MAEDPVGSDIEHLVGIEHLIGEEPATPGQLRIAHTALLDWHARLRAWYEANYVYLMRARDCPRCSRPIEPCPHCGKSLEAK